MFNNDPETPGATRSEADELNTERIITPEGTPPSGADSAPPAPESGLASPALTAPATLNLTTTETAMRGLALIKASWNPRPYAPHDDGQDHGLYSWALTGHPATIPTRQMPVLYWGSGIGAGGSAGRLQEEHGWIGADAWHGHGISTHRVGAAPLHGPVSFTPPPPQEWFEAALPPQWAEFGAKAARDFLVDDNINPTLKAEKIVIRLSIHVGDVGAPLNSRGAGAWATNAPEDWVAIVLSARLRAAQGAA